MGSGIFPYRVTEGYAILLSIRKGEEYVKAIH